MKAFPSLLTFSLSAALALGFSACDDDDDDAPDGGIAGASGGGGSGGTVPQKPANDLCKDAADLPFNQTISGTTMGASVDYEDSVDVFYKVTIENAGWYQFVLTSASKGDFIYMELWKSCAPADEQDSDHSDIIQRIPIAEGNKSEPVAFAAELQPGTYILMVNADAYDEDLGKYVDGSDFTLAYHTYQPTRPELTSVQAFIGQRTEESGYQLKFLALQMNGKDAGKDVYGASYALLDANGDVVVVEMGATGYLLFGPKFEADGQFKDAFTSHRLEGDLSAVASVKVWLIDDDDLKSEPKTVDVSRDYEVVTRNAGETCDFSNHATACAGDLVCDEDNNKAAVCMEDPYADKMCK